MKRFRLVVLGALVITVVTLAGLPVRHAQAQDLEEPRARQGYYIGLGLAQGGTSLTEKGHGLGTFGSGAYTLRFGQLLTRRIGLGLQLDLGGAKKGNQTSSYGGLTLEASVAVWRNLAIHAGTGLGFVIVDAPDDEEEDLRGGGGVYYVIGASYDFFPWRKRLTGGWAVTPTFDVHVSPDGNVKMLSFFVGVQVIRWSGLPENQLKQ